MGLLKDLVFPETDRKITDEIDRLNTVTIHWTSLVVMAVQTLSLIIYVLTPLNQKFGAGVVVTVVSVGLSILFAALAFLFSGAVMKGRLLTTKRHVKINIFLAVFLVLLLFWSMSVSLRHYIDGGQIITFFTVEALAVLFVRLRPIVTTSIIFSSFLGYYLFLDIFVEHGRINTYNYMTFAAVLAAGAVLNYRVSVGYIRARNKTEELNDSLKYIASHDNVTRLQNRYALTRDMPRYTGHAICAAMGDINGFKSVNDTFGHKTGDEVLMRFAKLLGDQFPHESIYRYGGDEFLIVTFEDAATTAARVESLNRQFGEVVLGGSKNKLGCSFGFAEGTPSDINDFISLIKEADDRLYVQKRQLGLKR